MSAVQSESVMEGSCKMSPITDMSPNLSRLCATRLLVLAELLCCYVQICDASTVVECYIENGVAASCYSCYLTGLLHQSASAD